MKPTRGYNSPGCHVWMPPFAQEDFERLDHVIGCGHVSGLQVRPDRDAGRYRDTRTWRKSFVRALSSVAPVAFPGPDLTDHLGDVALSFFTSAWLSAAAESSHPTFPVCGPRVIAERARAVDSAAIRAIVVRWLAPSEV